MILIDLFPLKLKRRRATLRAAGKRYRDNHREQERDRWRDVYRRTDYSKIQTRNLRVRFGATVADIEAQIERQGGRCPICNEVLRGGRYQHVDHDHTKPGTFRGVLCSGCNTGLGKFNDDPELLERGAVYLRQGGAR